jgi:hypothetical protein
MDVAQLLSQLEEPKLLMLFRHLIDEDARADSERLRATPLDLPDAELHAKLHLSVSSMEHRCAFWLFQLSHVPAFLWDEDSAARLMRARLSQAVQCLRTHPHLPKILRRELPPEVLFGGPGGYCPAEAGADYYYFTNYCHEQSEDTLELFSRQADQLFGEILGLSREQLPRFGIGTPETFSRSSEEEVVQFLIDVLKAPSSYYFVAREGRVEVAATVEHGVFVVPSRASEANDAQHGLIATATSTLKEHVPAGLSDLNTLINHPKTTERDLQRFFEIYPHFLLSLDDRYCGIRPHVCLSDGAGNRLIPDFLARIEDTALCDVIELKRPQNITISKARGIAKASAAAARGISELLQYADAFTSSANRAQLKKRLGMAPYDPCLVLVIGRESPSHSREWIGARAGFPKVRIVSYDYVFERARQSRRFLVDTPRS